jgi:hypothetical protein
MSTLRYSLASLKDAKVNRKAPVNKGLLYLEEAFDNQLSLAPGTLATRYPVPLAS